MTLFTPLGSKVTISFKVRFRLGISASHYGANGTIHIAAGRKCPPVQLQRVRTSMGTIGVPDAASNCYLHKGRPFNICMHDFRLEYLPSALSAVFTIFTIIATQCHISSKLPCPCTCIYISLQAHPYTHMLTYKQHRVVIPGNLYFGRKVWITTKFLPLTHST